MPSLPYSAASSVLSQNEVFMQQQPQIQTNTTTTISTTLTASPASGSRKRLQKQAKSLGQYEFKAMAFNSDLSQVQEKLAILENNPEQESQELAQKQDCASPILHKLAQQDCASPILHKFAQQDCASPNLHDARSEKTENYDKPPALPPKDYCQISSIHEEVV